MADLPINETAMEQLFQLLKPQDNAEEDALKPENLRYVLYTRKSTIDESCHLSPSPYTEHTV